ncbi:response regulator transcription factor [Agathobacter rectalis]|jgi:two-component system response regulator VanR|uniref:response regulator transcription factor n=1 Tax=Agathobacter rectalis TaxID=39491 RepID=UPI0027D278F0|nr:response regulator transcription factor [Agathobacter rectalis]MCB6952391.1 response regulator transcription factor [Agathobacter rectalis]
MATLLVIEDDINTNEAICEYMKSAGHTTLSALDGEEGLLLAKEPSVDLVVLDIMLPKIDGMTVLRELRKCSTVPVLMLTAIEDEHTQATSFDAEADDYITKPFSMVLLGKRITALLRRSGKNPEILRVQFGDIIVDFGGYAAWNQAGRIDLTPKEIELLKLLLEHKGLVLTRSQILDELWGYDAPIIDRTVDTYIKNLRKKLNLDRIITVKGVGYKYEESL